MIGLILLACAGTDAAPVADSASEWDGCADSPWIDVAAGNGLVCGLHVDGCGECWGRTDDADAAMPDRTWLDVELPAVTGLDTEHGCGRIDGGSLCWGRSSHGQTSMPDEEFEALALGLDSTCGIRTDGTIRCMGPRTIEDSTPSVRFSKIVGGIGFCGLTVEGAVMCWGYHGQTRLDSVVATDIAQSDDVIWALKSDRASAWWVDGGGALPTADFDVPDYRKHLCRGCFIRTDGSIDCDASGSASEPPAGEFSALVCADRYACALRGDGHLTCWGEGDATNAWYQVPGSYGG